MAEKRDKLELIQFILEFERDDLEKSELKDELAFGKRFDFLYSKPMSFLLNKNKIYKDYFN